jgi:hypothetical protein
MKYIIIITNIIVTIYFSYLLNSLLLNIKNQQEASKK